MRISVVVNTYNRAASLRRTLDSLRRQTHPDFEVVVVDGPSTDATAAVLADFAGQVRALACPVVQLSVSRNIGLAAAAGEVVAFIDDDSVATPRWLEELAAAYDGPRVGAAGGVVYDPTGVALQYRYTACRRDGRVVMWAEPPLDAYFRPGADPVGYLQGTNMSFRRSALREVGGFDEGIRYCYDDVETCLRVVDRGYQVRPLAGAAVHHKFLASHIRSARRVTTDPYNQLRDRIHFVLSNAGAGYGRPQRLASITGEADLLRYYAAQNAARGAMTDAQRAAHDARVDEALADGLGAGPDVARQGVAVPDPDPAAFRPFPTLRPEKGRLKLCFISREYPPGDFGGPGRYSHELAAGFASFGHEVHVVTRSPDVHRVDLEEGVWVHRVPDPDRYCPELKEMAAGLHMAHVVSAYHEVCRIHADGPIDLVSAPLWQVEGLVCGFDPRFPTTTTLITAMKAVTTMADWAKNHPDCMQMVTLEEELVARSRYLHAVSQPILKRAAEDYKADPAKAFVANLGLRDRAADYPRKRAEDGKVRVLYVGRLETRKGAGLFLETAARLCREFPDAEFVLAGKDIPLEGDNHRERFQAQYADDPYVLSRVRFTGMVTEDELYQHYADADVVCVPSKYESFGLVFVEAMIFGRPVIGSRAGGMVEVVADGEQGYLIPPGDVEALVECVRKLIADPDLRARFGRRSRELYERRFSVPVMVAGCEAAFRDVIAKHKAEVGGDPTAEAPREAVARQLAEVLARAIRVSPRKALAGARRLLDPALHPVDYVQRLRHAWTAPADEFARAFYGALLGRDVSENDVGWVHSASDRQVVLRTILASPDAQRRGHTDAWVPELVAAGGRSGPTLAARVRRRLMRTRGVGRLVRYARRAALLPWNFHKLFQAWGEMAYFVRHVAERQEGLERAARDVIDRQKAAEARLKDLLACQVQTQAFLDRQEERLARAVDALTATPPAVEFPRLALPEPEDAKRAAG